MCMGLRYKLNLNMKHDMQRLKCARKLKIIIYLLSFFFPTFFFDYLYILILVSSSKSIKYAEDFKKTEVRPLYKKDDRKEKSNYRPVSILSNVSKVYERCLCDQIYDFFENKFSSYQCGFRKGFNTQNELLSMVEDAISP